MGAERDERELAKLEKQADVIRSRMDRRLCALMRRDGYVVLSSGRGYLGPIRFWGRVKV